MSMNNHSSLTTTNNRRLQNSPNYSNRVAVVTGSSTGIGFETALLLARSGFHTYATMRDLKKSRNITEIAAVENLPLKVLQLDVNDDNSVKSAVGKIVAEGNRIDVLVNNAGYGLFSPLEDVTLDQIREQFETNFFGAIRVVHEVIPTMRRQRNGTIVNVSSLVGRVGLPLSSAYVSTKFALEGLSESVRYELNEFGINIILIEPGVIKTNFLENLKTADTTSKSESPYAELVDRTTKEFGKMMNSSSSPIIVAEAILRAITSKDPEFRYVVGDDAESIMRIRQNSTDKEFENWVYENILQQKRYIYAQE
jgi:NAD(P)-dependent dehydrogenase (short-subunit alcohol dehydrogenase family)